MQIPRQGRDLALTVSIGVTVSIGLTDYVAGETDRDMIQSADQALYLAKQAGRNRVIAIPVQTGAQREREGGGATGSGGGSGGGTPPPGHP